MHNNEINNKNNNNNNNVAYKLITIGYSRTFVDERDATLRTNKTLQMPFRIEGIERPGRNGLATSTALLQVLAFIHGYHAAKGRSTVLHRATT